MQRTVLMAILSIALAGFSTAAQDLVVDVNLTMLDVFVEDENGGAVLDLTAEDFEVLENGEPRSVKHLSLETQPLAAGLVVDRSSSVHPVKKQLDEAVMQLLKTMHPDDPVFLMTFAGKDKLNVTLTTAHEKIVEAVRKARLGYGTRVYDTIVHALRYLSTSDLDRKVLIIFSDGADHYSQHTFEQVLDTALFHAFPVYIVGYPGDDSRTWSEAGRREVQGRLERLATMTEGKAFFPEIGADCSAIARQILQRSRYQYRLGFYSSAPLDESSDLKVKLRSGGSRRVTIRNSRGAASIISD